MSINIKKKALNVKNGDTYDNFDMFFLGDIGDAVDDWFEEHPEAVTNVADNSITAAKLAPAVREAVEEVGDLEDEVTDLKSAIGNKASLNTDTKTNLVSAINEVNGHFLDGIDTSVENWLDDHPEATTTVQDGSLTEAKFTQALQTKVKQSEGVESCFKYGFVADYSGTPQYDGNDGSRITCTDNTDAFIAMINDCVNKGDLKVYFPAGHYGIKTGNIVASLSGCNLTIIGDGMGVSVIDFVKEDTSHESESNPYVNPADANKIVTITDVDNLIIQDITIKGTTKKDHGEMKIYAGAVWGIIIKRALSVKLIKCEVSDFSYRGITVDSSSVGYVTGLVEMIDCVGHNNTSSGFWISNAYELRVRGGEFYENGLLTDRSSGYAFTASSYVKKVTCENAHFYHNYSNGIDAHSCCDLTVRNCLFEDNVYRDISCHAWNANYDYSPIVTISNVTIYKGFTEAGKDWIKDVLTARMSNVDTSKIITAIMCLDDVTSSSVSRGILTDIYLDNVRIYGAYNGMDVNPNVYRTMIEFAGTDATLHINDCYFNFENFTADPTLTSNAKIGTLISQCKSDRIKNLTYIIPNSVRISNNKIGTYLRYNDSLVKDVEIADSEFIGYDAALMSGSGGDDAYFPNNSSIIIKNVNVLFSGGFQNELFKSSNYMLTSFYDTGNIQVITENYYSINTDEDKKIEIKNPIGKTLAQEGYSTNNFKANKFIYFGLSIPANTNLFSVIIPKTQGYYGVEVKFKNTPYQFKEDSIIILNENSSNPTSFTTEKSSDKLTVSSITEITDNGASFYKITYQNLSSFNGSLELDVCYSPYYKSIGIVDIVKEYSS